MDPTLLALLYKRSPPQTQSHVSTTDQPYATVPPKSPEPSRLHGGGQLTATQQWPMERPSLTKFLRVYPQVSSCSGTLRACTLCSLLASQASSDHLFAHHLQFRVHVHSAWTITRKRQPSFPKPAERPTSIGRARTWRARGPVSATTLCSAV